ncbi:MAG: hypothetical protein U0031_04545 [Thermomicrobiales bacterium]
MTGKPALDDIGRDYAALAFGIAHHVPGYIDAWLGSDDDRAKLDPESPPPPEDLIRAANALLDRIETLDSGDLRQGYLRTQARAMAATARKLAGDTLPYRDEVALLFDVTPAATPEAVFDAAIATLDQLLPGSGSVAARMNAWRATYTIPPERLADVVNVILPEFKTRTGRIVDLPGDEDVEIRLVQDQPWSGYNWYLGGGRSRVELNTDLPIHAFRLTDLLAHEAYPGHHTEHMLKERLYTEDGLGEHALQLINTPECVISEGIATTAQEMAFEPDEVIAFRAEQVYPLAGITADAALEREVLQAEQALRSVSGNAALLLHEGRAAEDEVVAYVQRYALSPEAKARQQVRFIADPLWRAYIFTYHVGHDLLANWMAGRSDAEKRARFRALLTTQVYPSALSSPLGAEHGDAITQ